MTKKEYIVTREKMITGQIDEDVLKLFYEYWIAFKKENYENIDFDTFASTFSMYLNYGMSYQSATNKVLKYFDELYSLQTVKSGETGETLAIC